jgi:TRAP-type transport system periplasmic protein
MYFSRRHFLHLVAGAAGLPTISPLARAQNATISDNRVFVMKIATETLNDGNHEWMKRFASAIETKSRGRIKAELYPASQLGSIPRQIEGTQLGSIQMSLHPPEFFVGIDRRFELLSAPGLFVSEEHAIKTITDPEFAKAFLALGADKGLIGAGLILGAPLGFAMRTPFRTLEDLRGKKIRVLASPFQTEQIIRLGGIGVPMSLADVLPALQQGTIDGALGGLGVFSTLGYHEVARYNETAQAYVFTLIALSKRWFETLPPDLQTMVLATAQEVGTEVNPWVTDFLARQRKIWVEKGGQLDVLSAADRTKMIARTSTIGDDIVKTKPDLKSLWDLLRSAVKRSL